MGFWPSMLHTRPRQNINFISSRGNTVLVGFLAETMNTICAYRENTDQHSIDMQLQADLQTYNVNMFRPVNFLLFADSACVLGRPRAPPPASPIAAFKD